MHYVLGIDGGATKTECVLMDEIGRVLSQSRSGPSNPLRVGFGGALASICEAARGTAESAALSPASIDAICAGLAGTGHSESERKMQGLVEEEFPGAKVHVCTDLELTLAATGPGPAIVLVAGTGSAAVGRDTCGHFARVGGRGPLLGDEGSAYDIGRRAAIHEFDRAATNSPLATRIFRELGISTWQEFQSRAHALPDEVFPRIFPVVVAAAGEGDPTSRQLLRNAAADLAALVSTLVERLNFQDQEFLLARTGGMLGRCSFLDQELDNHLRAIAPHSRFGALLCTPAEAAARLALQLLQPQPQQGN